MEREKLGQESNSRVKDCKKTKGKKTNNFIFFCETIFAQKEGFLDPPFGVLLEKRYFGANPQKK